MQCSNVFEFLCYLFARLTKYETETDYFQRSRMR